MDIIDKIKDRLDEEVIEEQLEEKEINKLIDALYKSAKISESKKDKEVSNILKTAIVTLRDLQRTRD